MRWSTGQPRRRRARDVALLDKGKVKGEPPAGLVWKLLNFVNGSITPMIDFQSDLRCRQVEPIGPQSVRIARANGYVSMAKFASVLPDHVKGKVIGSLTASIPDDYFADIPKANPDLLPC